MNRVDCYDQCVVYVIIYAILLHVAASAIVYPLCIVTVMCDQQLKLVLFQHTAIPIEIV